jgi:serine/threonine-protein kinase HipA
MSKGSRKKTDQLNLFINSISIGYLTRKHTGALSFTYDQKWLDYEHSFPISRRFLLQPESYEGQEVQNYFDNLLPDDRLIRERIAANTKATSTHTFDLLTAIGRDCVGAIQFYPENEVPDTTPTIRGEPLSHSEIAELIRSLRTSPLGIDPNQDFRISLAGVQNKTALLYFDSKWLRPHGSTPTTHIFKPPLGEITHGPNLSLSVENEWICSKILESFSIPVARTEIALFNNVKALVVERFDRQWSGKKLFRLPQEDLCQALGFGPEKKYESDGGPGIISILNLLNESNQRDHDRRLFMKSQLIFWLLSAIDGHAKNFSLFIRRSGFVLTPLYDVMSAYPHIHPTKLPAQKIKMAMFVGKSRHNKVNEIMPRHWLQTSEQAKFSGMEELFHEVSSETSKVIEKVTQKLPRRFPTQVSEPLFEGMLSRIKNLK